MLLEMQYPRSSHFLIVRSKGSSLGVYKLKLEQSTKRIETSMVVLKDKFSRERRIVGLLVHEPEAKHIECDVSHKRCLSHPGEHSSLFLSQLVRHCVRRLENREHLVEVVGIPGV